MASRLARIFIPVFGGQGTTNFDSATQFSLLSQSAFGSVLLDACFTVFHAELQSMDTELLRKVNICTSHFKDPQTLILPPYNHYISNPAFSMPALALIQTLQYLLFVHDNFLTSGSSTFSSFSDILQTNQEHTLGVIGFSSGVLTACIVATSSCFQSFMNHAVETYRLALWIGIQLQVYHTDILNKAHINHDSRPWSLVLIGISKHQLQRIVSHFNEVSSRDLVTITAVMSDKHFTISGHPEYLTSFVQLLPDEVVVQETKITTLYHCSSQLQGVRDKVLADIGRRTIKFPLKSELLIPIRSTFSGDLISDTISPVSLVELVVDMLLTQPVNWDLLVRKTVASVPPGIALELLNIGLGATLIREFERSLPSSQIFSISDIRDIESRLPPKVKQEPIAVIGMAANLPGAPDVQALWELLANGYDTLTEIPKERFCAADYTDAFRPGRSMKTRAGYFVENLNQFDNKFFNISPREGKSMDPQQRILLQVGYEALENAGYVPYGSPTFDPAKFGCYIGAATSDYVQNMRNNIDVYYSTGTLKAFLSGRLSYSLGLSGPSVVIDTACSSSLVAIHQACRALMNRDCDTAIAGGVNAISSPDMFIGLDRGHFLSPSGRCKPFDASADGYGRGEGCGLVVLKRLADAISENDQILGIIRGVEVNQSGTALSITHPDATTQTNLFKQLLSNSGVAANAVNVVEAHGTGTQAGDTTEMESVRCVLAVDRPGNNPLYVTSIKANIGHLEAASGCASLIKVLMMFQRHVIPRQISLHTLNPRIRDLGTDNIIISKTNIPWSAPMGCDSRVALINNFGAAGSNSAILVEEYVDGGHETTSMDGISFIFGLSAKDEISLESLRSKYLAWLQADSPRHNRLLNIAYTSTARRLRYPYRLAVSAAGLQQLVHQLQVAPISVAAEQETGVVFVFSGQGGQYYGMGCSLYSSSSTFRRYIDECDYILQTHGFSGIVDIIVNQKNSSLIGTDKEEFQSATFSIQYALSRLWISWGIHPKAVVGHSMGEFAALVTAGVMSLKDGLLFVAMRARLMFERCPTTTGMVAVSVGPVKLQAILNSKKGLNNVLISCYNSIRDCVLSGPLQELEELKTYLETERIGKVTRLRVPYAYHSPSMAPLEQDLIKFGRKMQTYTTRIPFISTVLGRVVLPAESSFPPQDYFSRQCLEPVRFLDGIESYLSMIFPGTMTWLEISPHPTVTPMLRSFPALSDSLLLGSLRVSEQPWTSLSKSLSAFYRGNYSVDWRKVFNEIGSVNCISMPTYPFSTHKFWTPFVEEGLKLTAPEECTKYTFVQRCIQFPNSGEDNRAIFQTPIRQIKRYIKGHRVGGIPLCPASVYFELVLAAIKLVLEFTPDTRYNNDILLHKINFSKPLILSPGEEDNSILTIEIDTNNYAFIIRSRSSVFEPESTHACGGYRQRSLQETERSLAYALPSVIRAIDAMSSAENHYQIETFSARTLYQVIFPRVVDYSAEFHTIQSLSMRSDGMEATGTMTFSKDTIDSSYSIHPLFIDSLIHIAGFISNIHADQRDAYICNKVGTAEFMASAIKPDMVYSLYCKIVNFEDHSCIVGESYAILDGPGPSRSLVAHLQGIRFQRVHLNGLKSGLASIARTVQGSLPGIGQMTSLLPSNVTGSIKNIVADACRMRLEDVSVDQDLDSLGVDSLMRIELSYDISKAFPGFGCRPKELSTCRNIRDIVDTIVSSGSSNCSVVDNVEFTADLPVTPPSMFSTPRTMVQSPASMRQIVARILEIEEEIIKDDIPLSSLGLDSLSSIEAIHTLGQEFHLKIPVDLINHGSTIRDLETQVSSLEPSLFPISQRTVAPSTPSQKIQAFRSRSLMLQQNATSDQTPLILIHDGSGLTISYERILSLNRRVWTVTNPKFACDEHWASLQQMAESYANLIKNEMGGPVILGGWSFGGVVAFEVARRLEARAMIVKGVILLDSPSPSSHVPLSSSLIECVLDATGNIEPNFRNACKIQFTTNAKLLSEYRPEVCLQTSLRLVFLKSKDPYGPANGLDVPPWLSERNNALSIIRGWQEISDAPLKIMEIPGHHFQAFDPKNISAVSSSIAEACNTLDR